MFIARSRIRNCKLSLGEQSIDQSGLEHYPCSPFPLRACQFLQMIGFFRKVPSPEQGTSAKMRSKSKCGVPPFSRVFSTLIWG